MSPTAAQRLTDMAVAAAGAGHNLPPADADPLRDRLAETHAAMLKRRDDLLAGADRVPAEIADEDTARKVADFIKQIKAHSKLADTTREGEKEPFLAGGRTVDGWFKGIVEPLDKAKKTVEARLTAYQRKKADQERREREEAERKAKAAAEEARKAALAAEQAAQSETDLQAAIHADAVATQAAADAAEAQKAAEAKPAELSRTRGDYGAVASLRAFWDFADLDRAALDLETLRPYLPAEALEKAVRAFVKAGGRELKGARIFENTATVVR